MRLTEIEATVVCVEDDDEIVLLLLFVLKFCLNTCNKIDVVRKQEQQSYKILLIIQLPCSPWKASKMKRDYEIFV